ncbi:cleavage and polyadenylation specificity factor subunit 3 [Nematocida sp. LUAm3]|nr:cleavage and polyadenylation specificity factor subunit 3 [Nematocida sp. LUAm3]KAI5175210.1 cleavage and polyadenylation specificity factor subunit 3 [Nematocida sp. LUAm2]KAI5178118.1 cleavage and polyadenylation specificity factor subunit 3 [Nematocida sp. LUAm1]
MEHSLYQTAVKILPLGAGNEVGRSCVLTKFRGTNLLFDCGVHPAHVGISSLPFFDLMDPSEVDVVLITHFHLDHAGALPYFTERTSFSGKVYMTHPTRAIFRWLLNDYVRVSNASSKNDLFSERELSQCYEKIIPIDYGQEIQIKNLTFIAYNAGHVLGAAMFLVRNEDISLLYTGDYSREEDRHLRAAQIPPFPVDILLSESTYGVQCHQSKEERESRFTAGVSEIVKRGGKCLLPVFALGRAQELLLILDEFWGKRKDLQGIPIYYASALAKRCMAVYQTYLNMMNDKIQGMAEINNPFHFKYVQSIKNIEAYEERGSCVIMASPGMLQNGLSRDLFEMWCGDRRNGCIIPGYCVEGTLAKDLLCEPEEILSLKGNKIPVRSSVDYISFSAHVDFIQNAEFIEGCKVSEVVLVHGESSEMARLKGALLHRAEMRNEEVFIHTPRNGEWIEIVGEGHLSAKYLGSALPERVEGFVHISEEGKVSVLQRKELSKLSLQEMKIQERVLLHNVSFSSVPSRISLILPDTPISVKENLIILEGVTIEKQESNRISIEWESNFDKDIIANCVIKALSEDSPRNILREKEKHSEELKRVLLLNKKRVPKHLLSSFISLFSNYYNVSWNNQELTVTHKEQQVTLKKDSLTGDPSLAVKVQELFDYVLWALHDTAP